MEAGVQTEKQSDKAVTPFRLIATWNTFKQLGEVLDQASVAQLKVEALFIPPSGLAGAVAQNGVVFCKASAGRTYKYTLIPFANVSELASCTRYGGKWRIIEMITAVDWPEYHRDQKYAALLEKEIVTTEGEST